MITIGSFEIDLLLFSDLILSSFTIFTLLYWFSLFSINEVFKNAKYIINSDLQTNK